MKLRWPVAAIGRPVNRRHNGDHKSRADTALCKPASSATSWLRGHDSAPHWGSCGKPPSSLYVRNGGAVLAEQFYRLRWALLGSDDSVASAPRRVAALVSPVSISHAAWDIHAVHGVHAMHSVKRLGTARFEPGAWGSLALGTPPPHRPARPAQPDTDEATDYLQRFVARGIVLTGTYVLKLRMSEGDLISGTLLSASSQPVDGQRSSAHGRSRHRAEGLPRT